MVVIGYIWKVAVNLVILFIVASTLEKLHDRTEVLVIAVLGMIYVTIRTTQGFQGLAMLQIALRHEEQLDAIRSWIDGTYTPGNRSEEWATRDALRGAAFRNSLRSYSKSLTRQ